VVHRDSIDFIFCSYVVLQGFQGAKYQKFRIREEAENFVHANTSFTAPATQHPSAPPFVQGPAILRTVPEPESEQGWTVIYTDGACKGNGKESAVAGVGVWFGDSHPK
jgi:ribonuclease HI